MNLTTQQRDDLLNLARLTIRRTLGDPTAVIPEELGRCCNIRSGCFVSLHTIQTHHLRGCIGLLSSTDLLRDVVIDMAQEVLSDSRFAARPVRLSELSDLNVELTILSSMEPANDPMDFQPLVHGIHLTCTERSGCFLPQVARETGWTKEQLLRRLCEEKMGLDADSWRRPDARLRRFTTIIIGPEPVIV